MKNGAPKPRIKSEGPGMEPPHDKQLGTGMRVQGSLADVMAFMIISAASPRVTGRPKWNSRSDL